MSRRDQPLLRHPALSACEWAAAPALLARCIAVGLVRPSARSVSDAEARSIKQAQVYARRNGKR